MTPLFLAPLALFLRHAVDQAGVTLALVAAMMCGVALITRRWQERHL